jgi:hypothetical protein
VAAVKRQLIDSAEESHSSWAVRYTLADQPSWVIDRVFAARETAARKVGYRLGLDTTPAGRRVELP